jgi:hypothetical protein
VIVNDLDVEGIAAVPAKADSPLIIDANAVLSLRSPFSASDGTRAARDSSAS